MGRIIVSVVSRDNSFISRYIIMVHACQIVGL
jgi:hypothetical protein